MSALRETIARGWIAFASRNRRVALLDFALLAFSVYLGYALRLSIIIAPEFRDGLAASAFFFPACVVSLLALGGAYRVHWPQASVEEYARLLRWYLAGAALFLGARFFIGAASQFLLPRSSVAITFLGGLIMIGTARASWRFAELASSRPAAGAGAKRAIIIGAGEAGAYIARDLTRRSSGLLPLGFVDSDPDKAGKRIAGLPVLGDDDALADVVRSCRAEIALLAIPSAGGDRVRKYLSTLEGTGAKVRVLPSLRELAGGRVELASMRPVQLQDLLRRDAITLDEAGIEAVIAGKCVLVTGAGGSIGSELCAQIARHGPREIIMLGHGEGSIYGVLQLFAEQGITAQRRPVIADTADEAAMRRVFERYRPEVVFHAAAHKHVPLMEDNPREALRVNGVGTWTTASLAGEYGAERFVMISTDKAVHPSSVMGATKRVAERMVKAAQGEWPGTAYMAVRFGNVLGSRGSVVPLFERQIARGGPVTVTHPDMTRYFMLIPEAVNLVLQAASMGRGGELFVLDMGEPVRIEEMARTLIRLHGLEPDKDIKIEFTGTRPGEKLFEELFYDPAHVAATAHGKIFLSKLDIDGEPMIDSVREAIAEPDDEAAREAVFRLASGEGVKVKP